ncbi:hypothetical protein HPP92_002181 [Vanilla planifolia]|uniref:Glycosyltransferase 61 catalytic domain-containing protein n=1 Tax=Vanilla planifolia TaxID=51239 RepID=A0A835S5X6_VANPL|nr:hypothetical protein HPP92_002181 [Vanilla planifolia]
MSRTSPVALLSRHPHPPPCDAVHPSPAFIFSAGGFAGNFFHDINDVLLPLFLTASPVLPNLHLVITDLQPYWSLKYRPFLRRLSSFAPISPTPTITHCFPSAVLGLKYHGELLCNETEPPGTVSSHDFRRFLHRSLPADNPSGGPPLLVLLSRRKSRVLLNEEAAAGAARDAGFRVLVATPQETGRVEEFGSVVRGCGVLVGVHGAGLTNLVFLRPGAVVVQIVPWGLDWASEAYYGRPARRMGLEYLEYRIAVEESTLRGEYAEDDPVLADPWGVNLKGYNVSRPVYVDGQNVSLDLRRFGETLQTARRLLLGIAR